MWVRRATICPSLNCKAGFAFSEYRCVSGAQDSMRSSVNLRWGSSRTRGRCDLSRRMWQAGTYARPRNWYVGTGISVWRGKTAPNRRNNLWILGSERDRKMKIFTEMKLWRSTGTDNRTSAGNAGSLNDIQRGAKEGIRARERVPWFWKWLHLFEP